MRMVQIKPTSDIDIRGCALNSKSDFAWKNKTFEASS